jgi:GNAT superfamily N-acetyltransferase
VLAAFDEQVRRNPVPVTPAEHVERDEHVVRLVSRGDRFTGVTWSDLDEGSADRVIAAQIERFAELRHPWEWKHYSWDRPRDLPERLRRAGFTPEPPEAMLVGETAELPRSTEPPPGVIIAPVTDAQGVSSFVSVNDEVFGNENSWIGEMLLDDLARQGDLTAAMIAIADDETTVAALRLEFPSDTDFASLYSACTLPAWRGRGVFRSLLARGVSLAASRGFRYLQTDALPDSQPILKRLGCVELGTTTPFAYPGSADSAAGGRPHTEVVELHSVHTP